MSKEQLKAFLERVKGDTSLQEILKSAEDEEAVVAIANSAGFGISADDLKRLMVEITDDDLAGASGGGTGAMFGWIIANCATAGIPLLVDLATGRHVTNAAKKANF